MASFAPEVILHIGSLPITNTILNTIFVDAVLIGSAFFISKNLKKIPGVFQNIMEFVIDSFYNLTESVSGKNAAKIFPWFMSFFLFILVANWSGLIPGVGTVGFFERAETHEVASDSHSPPTNSHAENRTEDAAHEETHFKPLVRNATSELNVTLALAVISLVVTHYFAITTVGFGEYLSRYFSLNPVMLFVGMLEIVSEFTKVVSLSFRLFGNIYAGEVVLHTISSIFAFIAPVPFMLLEVIVGLVQALVFSMLTMVFMSILMTPHHAEEQTNTGGALTSKNQIQFL